MVTVFIFTSPSSHVCAADEELRKELTLFGLDSDFLQNAELVLAEFLHCSDQLINKFAFLNLNCQFSCCYVVLLSSICSNLTSSLV
jgi:hypothetical protein